MKCDLHVHTYYSYDSTSRPSQIAESAAAKGIHCLAITDHGTLAGIEEMRKCALSKSILIIPGIEVKSQQGDILGLNITDVIPDGLTAEETVHLIKEQKGLAVIAHPFSSFYGFKGSLESMTGDIDALEIKNASLFKKENEQARKFANDNNLSFTAGSDAHFAEDIGRVYLEIPGRNLSTGKILEAIRLKNVSIHGEETSFFRKIINLHKRSLAKISHYAGAKQKKI